MFTTIKKDEKGQMPYPSLMENYFIKCVRRLASPFGQTPPLRRSITNRVVPVAEFLASPFGARPVG
jgi:hypothetical protein